MFIQSVLKMWFAPVVQATWAEGSLLGCTAIASCIDDSILPSALHIPSNRRALSNIRQTSVIKTAAELLNFGSFTVA